MALCTATFETGVNNAALSTGDAGSATAFDSVVGGPTYANDHAAFGTLSMETTGAGQYFVWSTALGTVTDIYGRQYLYCTDYPPSVFRQLVTVRRAGGGETCFTVAHMPDGTLALGDSAGFSATGTVPVTTNQWVRIEWHVLTNTSTGVTEAKLFNTASSATPDDTLSASGRNTLGDATSVRNGNDAGGAGGTYWLDQIVSGDTTWPGPFSDGALAPWLKTL